MAFTTGELVQLAQNVRRALAPGGFCVFTVRNTSDPDYGRGIHRGEGRFENQGFIVHFFDRAKVERVAKGSRSSRSTSARKGRSLAGYSAPAV
jgi:hypothetical protein